MTSKLKDKVVFVTGSSAGIGEALVREASAQGAHVVISARREDRIRAIADELVQLGGQALAVRADVTAEGSVEAAVQEISVRFGRLDVVIANAGFGVEGQLNDLSLEDYRRQFETNVFGVIRTIKAAMPELKASKGCIGVMGSTNGYLNVPGWSAYCMSKHAVRSLCACVKHELAEDGVSITHLAPGFVESDFRKTGNDSQLKDDAQDPVPKWLQVPARDAARTMLRAVICRQEEAVISMHAKAAVGLERHVPWFVSKAVAASGKIVRSLSKDAG
ncbi:MAG TPA: SDR family NAD(P)-dependent oxidoreductase [Polyangiaceae bacterium]|nr:SDR family NAD(P)-dependent oxidoreductase [Polyangiaceae bacterium]